jgi:hypothetical protein
MTSQWQRPDVLICNGDAIEGNQSRQGGAELITPDRSVQCDMAIEALSQWNAKKVFMTYGTPYHVGQEAEDFERGIAKKLKAKIEGHLFLNIEGVMFDIRHKVNTSAIPHGRATALLRSLMWAVIKDAEHTAPKVDVLIRSHAHYYVGVDLPRQKAFITPGLQLARGRFGARECDGSIWWGALRFTVQSGAVIKQEKDLCELHANRPTVFKVA